MSDRLTFAYLMYTTHGNGDTHLLGVYKSLKAAKSSMDLVNGVYIDGTTKRVLQKSGGTSGQYWYVEKHVMRDAV